MSYMASEVFSAVNIAWTFWDMELKADEVATVAFSAMVAGSLAIALGLGARLCTSALYISFSGGLPSGAKRGASMLTFVYRGAGQQHESKVSADSIGAAEKLLYQRQETSSTGMKYSLQEHEQVYLRFQSDSALDEMRDACPLVSPPPMFPGGAPPGLLLPEEDEPGGLRGQHWKEREGSGERAYLCSDNSKGAESCAWDAEEDAITGGTKACLSYDTVVPVLELRDGAVDPNIHPVLPKWAAALLNPRAVIRGLVTSNAGEETRSRPKRRPALARDWEEEVTARLAGYQARSLRGGGGHALRAQAGDPFRTVTAGLDLQPQCMGICNILYFEASNGEGQVGPRAAAGAACQRAFAMLSRHGGQAARNIFYCSKETCFSIGHELQDDITPLVYPCSYTGLSFLPLETMNSDANLSYTSDDRFAVYSHDLYVRRKEVIHHYDMRIMRRPVQTVTSKVTM